MDYKVLITNNLNYWPGIYLLGKGVSVYVFLVLPLILIGASAQAATLEQLVHQALKNHPKLAAQQAIIDAKEVGIETAEWQYYPTLSASYEAVSAAKSDVSYAGDTGVTTLRIEQPLWSGGRLAVGVDLATSKVALEQIQLQVVQINIAESVLDAYGKWVSGYRTMQAWERGLKLHKGLEEQVQNRVNHGVSAPIDLALAQGRVASTHAQYLAAKSESELALDEINQLTQFQYTPTELAKHLSASQPTMVSLNSHEIWNRALLVDPQIAFAQNEIGLAKLELHEQEAAINPNVYFRAEQQVNSFSTAQVGSSMRFFIGISGNSGAGLSLLSQNNGAAAMVLAKQAVLVAIQYTKRQKLAQLVSKIKSLHYRIDALASAMKITLAVSESYSRQFLAGRKTWQEVLNSAREQVQMEVQIVDLEAAVLVAQWRLALYTLGHRLGGET